MDLPYKSNLILIINICFVITSMINLMSTNTHILLSLWHIAMFFIAWFMSCENYRFEKTEYGDTSSTWPITFTCAALFCSACWIWVGGFEAFEKITSPNLINPTAPALDIVKAITSLLMFKYVLIYALKYIFPNCKYDDGDFKQYEMPNFTYRENNIKFIFTLILFVVLYNIFSLQEYNLVGKIYYLVILGFVYVFQYLILASIKSIRQYLFADA